jgi:pimeloyl-ACP methyl ester carboxylesterase
MRDSRHWGDFPQTFVDEIDDAEVITLDLPGNGVLHRERSPSRVEEMAVYCREELRRRNMAPPYNVLAMSLGAMVTVAWAEQHPQELQACVLINTSLRPFSPFYRRLRPAAYIPTLRMALANPDARACEEMILQLTSRRLERTRAVLDDWTAWRCEYPVSRANALRQLFAAARFRAPRNPPLCRLLLLTSTQDRLVDVGCSRRLARAWDCDIAEHPSAGHDLPLDDGTWVAQQVRQWW